MTLTCPDGPYRDHDDAQAAFDRTAGTLRGPQLPALAEIRLRGTLTLKAVDLTDWEQTQIGAVVAACTQAQLQMIVGWLLRAVQPDTFAHVRALYTGPYDDEAAAMQAFDKHASILPTPAIRRTLAFIRLGGVITAASVALSEWERQQITVLAESLPEHLVQTLIGWIARAACASQRRDAPPSAGRSVVSL